MASRNRFKGKLAYVIGGSEGIGKSVAKQLAQEGASVVIFSRSREKLMSALKEIESVSQKALRAQLKFVELDIRDYEQVRERFRTTVQDVGTPDYLINCAGYARPGYLEDIDIKDIRNMIDLNYLGTVHIAKAMLPYLVKKGAGHIVTTSSIAGFIGLFGYTGYCGSKFAVIGFSEALKRELAPQGINVSVLCPPNTRTPGLDNENKFKPAEVLATEEKVKVVDPDFVASALLSGMLRKKFMIVPTFDGSLAHKLNRYLPGVLELFVKRKATL